MTIGKHQLLPAEGLLGRDLKGNAISSLSADSKLDLALKRFRAMLVVAGLLAAMGFAGYVQNTGVKATPQVQAKGENHAR